MDNFASFRRMTTSLLIPVDVTPSTFTVPPGFILSMFTAFLVVNPNQCWVGVRGTTSSEPGPVEPILASTDGIDWLWGPGHIGVYTTSQPVYISAVALAMPGWDLPLVYTPLRISYGVGS